MYLFKMDTPISLSQCFVNKQNIRSIKNIINGRLLRSEVLFIQDIFVSDLAVSDVPEEFLNILRLFMNNLREKSRGDFRNYFGGIEKPKILTPLNKDEIFTCTWTALSDLIPKPFYGSYGNSKLMHKIVHAAVFSMKKQCVVVSKYVKSWDFACTPWNLFKDKYNILSNLLLWIIKYPLSAIISLNFYVTTCKLDADENKLNYFWKHQWQSFYDKKLSNMILAKVLKRFDPYCLGKKSKMKYNLSDRLKLKALTRDIPKLYLILKPNNDSRPIVRYKSDHNSTDKYKFKERFAFLKKLTGNQPRNVESEFNAVYKKWLELNRTKLYFIKTDLSNAFGMINKDKLLKILCERHLKFQKEEKNLYVKKKFAQHYKDMITELRKPLLVRAGNTVYEWTEGLVQGYKYSPALSELYYAYLDEIYFKQHLNTPDTRIRFFTRIVDDYLYITDCLEDAQQFLEALSQHRNVNYEKTIVNFPHEVIKYSEEITFLGYSYNTVNMEVSRATNVFSGQMCYKIAFSNAIVNLKKFLENRIGQSGIQINGHIFNLHYNPEILIWSHIFTTFCLSANKLCTILAVCELNLHKNQTELKQFISIYKKRVTVKLANSMIDTILRNKPSEYFFGYCINHFRYLSFKALYLCATQTSNCKSLVPFIKDEMAKSNCIFGKWRPHACRIDSNGESRRQAMPEICRRTDLRKMISFDNLPSGFQCYQRKLK